MRAARSLAWMVAEAVRETSEGILIDVAVRAGARETRVTGYDRWRRAVTVDLAAVPRRGEANRALEAFVESLGGRQCAATVVRGATSRRKTVLVRGTTRDRLLAALAEGAP